MEDFFKNFLQNSFSVAVSVFLLVRMEKELRLLRDAIERLRHCQNCRLSPFTPEERHLIPEEDGSYIVPAGGEFIR